MKTGAQFKNNKYPKTLLLSAAIGSVGLGLSFQASADQYSDAARKWVNEKFDDSTLTKEEQMKEMEWFIQAAKQFRGMDINVVSETIAVHEYESSVLAKAFSEITGINLTHTLIQEGDVIEKLQTQMQSGRNIYDGWVNDSDLIGTHFRYGKAMPVEDIMNGEGKDLTLPTLDLDDFIGLDFATAPDGKLYQLPDQQFANLYWFRADWFERADLKKQFKDIYGYELGVPVNWSAYEDIAEFFSVHVKEIDGKRVYGHMDYGKKDPSLGWRFTDAWFSMAGAGDKGLPNGLPVDEWGIRVDECHPVGSSVSRGGATNGPAAVYATTKYVDWLEKYAPPEAQGMTFYEAGPVHRVYRQHDQRRPARGKRRRHPEMAHGSLSPWTLLGRGHEAWLSGHGFLDLHEVHAAEASSRRMAVRPVHGFQDRVPGKNHGWPDTDSRV